MSMPASATSSSTRRASPRSSSTSSTDSGRVCAPTPAPPVGSGSRRGPTGNHILRTSQSQHCPCLTVIRQYRCVSAEGARSGAQGCERLVDGRIERQELVELGQLNGSGGGRSAGHYREFARTARPFMGLGKYPEPDGREERHRGQVHDQGARTLVEQFGEELLEWR